jgi:hypothetical protein
MLGRATIFFRLLQLSAANWRPSGLKVAKQALSLQESPASPLDKEATADVKGKRNSGEFRYEDM